ncbi:MAG: hypothetical protein AAFY60_13330, partial [Myxococcota bacterium]
MDIELEAGTHKYREWLRGANNGLCVRLETAAQADLRHWSQKLAPHAVQNVFMPHNVACGFSMAGDLKSAFEMCELAIRQGYPDAFQLPMDAQLGPIKERVEDLVRSRPGWRSSPAPLPGWEYSVDTERSAIPNGAEVPELLEELA